MRRHPIIRLKQVSKQYHQDELHAEALHCVSLSIFKGEFVAIMGPSGSGKSTLMHIMGALDIPTKGQYFFEGKDITHLNDQELSTIRNHKIGFIFQNFNLLPRMSVLDNVELPMDYTHIHESEQTKIALDCIQKVGLSDRLKFPPNKLSGGQMQRVAIARALTMNPSIILADEPTGNIGSAHAKEIMELFTQLNKHDQHTIVMITHEPTIAKYASRIITIQDGQISKDVKK
jgi:putative ABC transport system ATP-binding protein